MTSTVKFDRWQNTAGDTIADVSSGGFTGDNLLYNGAMRVAQRGTSSTGITSSGYYTADRWNHLNTSGGTWTQTVEADGPSGSGFTKSLKMEVTTANGSLSANSRASIVQALEGQDLQGLKKGTAEAESLTLSFWVKSNVTGTYIAEIYDGDNNRQISASYTVSSSGTWEKKTITLAGDTVGAYDNDNAGSLNFTFWLAAGSDYTTGTLNTSWASAVIANRVVGQVNVAASTSNYWQVTGVQLEVGTVANGFEHKPYGVELAECQRYYVRFNDPDKIFASISSGTWASGTAFYSPISLPVTLRSAPSSVEYSSLGVSRPGVAEYTVSNVTLGSTSAGRHAPQVSVTTASSGASQGQAGILGQYNSASGYLGLSAEL